MTEFPYVFKCKKCEEQHIAISLQPWVIEWLYDRLKHYAKEKEDKQRQMEAGIASHILEVNIKPALDELIDKGLTGGYILRLGKSSASCGATAYSSRPAGGVKRYEGQK